MLKNKSYLINPDEGEIVIFHHKESNKSRPAINLEPYKLHEPKDSFNAVLTTTQKLDKIYPHDYPLFESKDLDQPCRVICDQPTRIFKNSVAEKIGKVTDEELKEIRKRLAESVGILYTDATA